MTYVSNIPRTNEEFSEINVDLKVHSCVATPAPAPAFKFRGMRGTTAT